MGGGATWPTVDCVVDIGEVKGVEPGIGLPAASVMGGQDKDGGEQREVERKDPEDAAGVEVFEVKGAFAVAEKDAGNEEAREDKEEVYAEPADARKI